MGSMMGGSSAPSTQTVTNKTEIPAYLQDYAKANMKTADEIAARPYVAYEGQRQANFSDSQWQGIKQKEDTARYAPLDDLYDPAIKTATDNTTSSYGDTLAPGDIEEWMSPYIEGALKSQLQAVDREGIETAKKINYGATGAGAFGDARTGVQQGENDRNTAELKSNVRATGYQDAYDRAVKAAGTAYTANTSQYNADRTANLASADELAKLISEKYGYQQKTADDLIDAGKLIQDQEQESLAQAYQDFINQSQYPEEMLNLRLATQAGTPYATTRLTTTPYSSTAQGIGALSALYGLTSSATK